jgi:hypothetical protein
MPKSYQWGLDLVDALSFDQPFAAAPALPGARASRSIRPTPLESVRADANIHAWRGYLPEACVSCMIEDGWQWSTWHLGGASATVDLRQRGRTGSILAAQ